MILDYIPATSAYVLKVQRNNGTDVNALMRDHGLDFSIPASSASTAVMFTREPYAAATFSQHATPRAREQLGPMLAEIEASWAPSSKIHVKCPPDKELWPFQKANIEYALRRQNVLVGDQPGLGKTASAICFANELQAERILVVVPASIRKQWVTKIQEWSTLRYPYIIHPIYNGRNGVHPKAPWTVVSYELARVPAIAKALAAREYDLLILDEAHFLKSVDAKRTRSIFRGGAHTPRLWEPIAERCKRIMALTGTPLPNRPREAYTLARGMHHDCIDWMSEDHFRERFNPSMRMERVDPRTGRTIIYTDERSGRHAELQNRLRANFMTRHLKRDVMMQLKLPIYDVIQLEETEAVKQALAAESLLEIDPEQFEGADFEINGHVAIIRRQMGEALAPQIADYVEMLIDGGETKLVLFAWHHSVMTMLMDRLGPPHGFVRIDGTTSVKEREAKIARFISDPDCQGIVGQMQSMGIGTDGLQHVSNHALICEPSWTAGDNLQAFDRLDRGGQKNQVQGDIFVAPNSFAERVLVRALRKNQVTHAALDKRF